MTDYIIELRVKSPIKRFKVSAEDYNRAIMAAEDLAKENDMHFIECKKAYSDDVYDTVIHKVENLKEF